MRGDVAFRSDGAEMSGRFYSPDTPLPWPLVAMTHGFSATKQMGTDLYADVFDEARVAVLLFDNRGFGASGCQPR